MKLCDNSMHISCILDYTSRRRDQHDAVGQEQDRPQPRLDRETDRGYTVSVGRIREDEAGIFDIKFVALSHNSKFSPGDFASI